MQSEQFASQPKRLRSEAKTFAEDSPNPLLAEEVIDGNSLNKRETIDNLISTLQRLRDEGDSLPPSTVDVLNSMGPALQAVPYIVPQQKLVKTSTHSLENINKYPYYSGIIMLA
ncbi:hypothetical protein COOONC_11009 [Cooperia oncophora]